MKKVSTVSKLVKKSILAIGLSAISLASALNAEARLNFASDVSLQQQRLILQDLELLKKLDLSSASQQSTLAELFESDQISGESLHSWFHQRIKWIVGDISRYPLMAVHATEQSYREYRYNKLPGWMSSQIGGINFGAVLYDLGHELSEKFDTETYIRASIDNNYVDVTSPRAGILLIGDGLFDPTTSGSRDLNSFAAKIFRIAVLLHEARHSDGNEAAGSLGFGHTICPQSVSRELRGQYACDAAANGSHRVSVEFFRAVIESCGQSCTQQDRRLLTTHYQNALARIPVEYRQSWLDPSPSEGFEAVDPSMFQRLSRTPTLLDF